ncbi:isochorismatase family protein [Aquitalea sp. LB_tupeE]|uniref:isochorismatase family protein n=1 Tax=Aquitalea sp. LB_tupeE TaxID=2748078 RepID=UPI0015BF0F92|nr:isochorismatase family protein [Aquitalea sp. LB_tupeE]NWK78060.1 isochorismatase family protein [Aquitalea sp. LB_tupeE]
MPDSALLIVDMQCGVVAAEPAAVRLEQVLNSLNLAIAKARQRGLPVIFVQHEEAGLERGSAAWQLHPALPATAADHFIYKRHGDSFCDTPLAALLENLGVSKLWLGGCATDFCLDSTLRNAVSRGFQVTVIGDGHTTLSAFALSGEQVIDHFNAVWDATNATPQPLLVQPAAAL